MPISWDGRPMYTYTVGRWFNQFLQRRKLPPIRFHDLRHTAATLLIAEGIPLKNISARLGHANTNTTATIYAHALQSVDRLAAEKMDNLLTKNKQKKQA
ncbi:MAG: site-specific integrase [Peptococcaceae bacterium]|nr:MAG: site-specific integrase [Peptococcaceae bacterium]